MPLYICGIGNRLRDMQQIALVAATADAKLLEQLRRQIAQQQEITLSGEARDTLAMARIVRRLQPDVLLVEALFLGAAADGADSPVLADLHRRSPRSKIILLADHCSERLVASAFQQGARGRITSAAVALDCLRPIRAVHQGEIWVSRLELAYVLNHLLGRLQGSDGAEKSSNLLSGREAEIANSVRLGLTNKEIARKLRISDATVKTHLEHIFHKLNVSRRIQLATLARDHIALARRAGSEPD